MKKINKPQIRLHLNPDNYNSLISILSFFIATENEYGKTYFSQSSAKLKSKILKYSRIVKNKDSESICVHFFENETVDLMKVVIKYVNMSEEPTSDFFTQLKLQKCKVGV